MLPRNSPLGIVLVAGFKPHPPRVPARAPAQLPRPQGATGDPSGADELAAALRTSSQDNPEGGTSFLIQGGRGESKKVITEQAKIILEEPFLTSANLRAGSISW